MSDKNKKEDDGLAAAPAAKREVLLPSVVNKEWDWNTAQKHLLTLHEQYGHKPSLGQSSSIWPATSVIKQAQTSPLPKLEDIKGGSHIVFKCILDSIEYRDKECYVRSLMNKGRTKEPILARLRLYQVTDPFHLFWVGWFGLCKKVTASIFLDSLMIQIVDDEGTMVHFDHMATLVLFLATMTPDQTVQRHSAAFLFRLLGDGLMNARVARFASLFLHEDKLLPCFWGVWSQKMRDRLMEAAAKAPTFAIYMSPFVKREQKITYDQEKECARLLVPSLVLTIMQMDKTTQECTFVDMRLLPCEEGVFVEETKDKKTGPFPSMQAALADMQERNVLPKNEVVSPLAAEWTREGIRTSKLLTKSE